MKKILLSMVLLQTLTTTAFAIAPEAPEQIKNLKVKPQGEILFEKHCMLCHNLKHVSELTEGIRFAPSMLDVSNRMKENILVPDEDIKRFTMISFIKEYVKNPSFDYSIYDNTGTNPYDLMPTIEVPEKDLQLIAEWIYDKVSKEKFN